MANAGQKISYPELAVRRIIADLAVFHQDKPPGIYIHSDEEDIGRMLILMIGPGSTPYEDGFFFFEMQFPQDYPFSPPYLEIRTTNPEYRFNPNFYLEGKVCLSILGTWAGPSWTMIMNIVYTLISVQSRMNEMPLENEPGWENCPKKQMLAYNSIVRELTLRYSVLDQLGRGFPRTQLHPHMTFEVFRPIMTAHFLQKYENYLKLIDTIPNTILSSRFGFYSGRADPIKMRKDFETLRQNLLPLTDTSTSSTNSTSTSASSTSTSTSSIKEDTSTSSQDEENPVRVRKPLRIVMVPRGNRKVPQNQ